MLKLVMMMIGENQSTVTAIWGTDELLLRTQLKQANHGHEREKRRGAILTTYQLFDRGEGGSGQSILTHIGPGRG
jgi:hypothetical protein